MAGTISLIDSVALEGDGDGATAGFVTATPLFHTSFLPDLTQVNFLPETELVVPTFAQAAPALTAAMAGVLRKVAVQTNARNPMAIFFIASTNFTYRYVGSSSNAL
jgi:hypothetical protein